MPRETASPAALSTLRGLLPFLHPYRARVALAFVLLCLGSAAILVVPLAFRDLIDAGFGGVSAGECLRRTRVPGCSARRAWTVASSRCSARGVLGGGGGGALLHRVVDRRFSILH